MSQEDVAKKLGLSRPYYARIELGKRQEDLELSLLIGLAKVFEVSIDYIIAEEEKLKKRGIE